MEKYKYYIKTEKELISDYGTDWIDNLPRTDWVSGGMEHLFGKELEYDWYKEYVEDDRLNVNNYNNPIKVPTGNDSRGYWIVRTDCVKEVVIVPNYNTPRQLVYESIMGVNKYDVVGVVCKSREEYVNTQKILFSNGYKWNGSTGENIVQGPAGRYNIIIFKKNMKITRSNSNREHYIDNYIIDNYSSVNSISINSRELKKLFNKPNYNEPRQLVYESKILKFNEYKKGE